MSNHAATFACKLLEDSFQKHASDIHFHPSPQSDQVSIYYRILGNRIYKSSVTKSFYQIIISYFKFSSSMDLGESRRPQNGTISWTSNNQLQYDLRLSTLPVNDMESLTIRIFPQEEAPTLDQLFLFPIQFQKMKKWLRKKAGLIVLTGPTGSGKTTTMYALLESMLQEQSFQIITLEDPIERKLENVLQVEVNEKAGITYQAGLKAALRHDPDVLLIGEIRDEHTAKFAIRASLTGHLVLTTLHAKNAKGTIDRLMDLGIQQNDLTQALIAVAAVQLLPIKRRGYVDRRAAIVELLEEDLLIHLIKGEISVLKTFHSFQILREKAYRYGFITKETYDNSKE